MGLHIDTIEIDNLASDPVSPVEGQMWYNTTEKKLKIYCASNVDIYLGKFTQTTADPTATDDSAAGYTVSSRWINTTTGKEFVCLDATATAAVWRRCSFVFGTGAGTVCEGNDSRLSDARTPTAHTHAAADVTTGVLATARGGVPTGGAAGQVLTKIDGTDNNVTWATPGGQAPEYAESEAESTTSSTSYVEKLKLTTSSLPTGTYLISYGAEINSEGNTQVFTRIHLDDTTVLAEPVVSPSATDYMPLGGMKRIVGLTAGVHTIDMDFRTTTASKAAKIRRARVFIQRIA